LDSHLVVLNLANQSVSIKKTRPDRAITSL
jgi:hypothetical protein